MKRGEVWLTRLDGRAGQRPDVGELVPDRAIARIEEERAHDLTVPGRQDGVKESGGGGGVAAVLGRLVRCGLLADQGHAVAGDGLRLEARLTGLDEIEAILGLRLSALAVGCRSAHAHPR